MASAVNEMKNFDILDIAPPFDEKVASGTVIRFDGARRRRSDVNPVIAALPVAGRVERHPVDLRYDELALEAEEINLKVRVFGEPFPRLFRRFLAIPSVSDF